MICLGREMGKYIPLILSPFCSKRHTAALLYEWTFCGILRVFSLLLYIFLLNCLLASNFHIPFHRPIPFAFLP